MKRNLYFVILLSLLAATASFTSCKKEDKKVTEAKEITYEYDMMKDTEFKFFSLKTGKMVTITEEESLKSKDWDIAILSKCIKTNGGASTSVNALGEAAETTINVDNIATMKLPSDLVFEKDKIGPVGLMNNPKRETGRNELLNKAFGFTHSASGPVYKPSKNVFIVRGADGTNYAFAFGTISTKTKVFLYKKLD